jgi:Flp pilus assembly protein, secretin CpaC
MLSNSLLFRIRLSLLAGLASCTLAVPLRAVADEPMPAEKQFVEVKLWVFEVSTTKLRTLCFDEGYIRGNPKAIDDQQPKRLDDEQFLKFLTALEQNNLVQKLSSPMIATRSGQKASIEISPYRKIEVTPTIIDGEQIGLDYHVEVATASQAKPDKVGRRLVSACSTELKSGVGQLLSETTSLQRTAQGKPNDSTILVYAQATIVK